METGQRGGCGEKGRKGPERERAWIG
jgi:hypothetical protein